MIPGIAISGKAGAGKTTVANVVVELLRPFGAKKYALADAIKRIDAELFLPTNGKPRTRYQHIGTSMRELDADVWIRALDREISKWPHVMPIVEDTRNLNEYEHYRAAGFAMIRVETSYENRVERMSVRDGNVNLNTLEHFTEHALDGYDFDHYIYNDDDIDDLRAQVAEMLRWCMPEWNNLNQA